MLPIHQKIIAENLIEVGKQIASSTPPLFIKDYKKPEIISSSILVGWNANYFLITSGHTLKDFVSKDIGIIFNKKFIQLGGPNGTSTVKEVDREDRIDIGFFHLSGEFLHHLSSDFTFYDLANFEFDHEDTDEDNYLIVGHPLTRTKVIPSMNKIFLSPFMFKTDLNRDQTFFNKTGASESVNFLLNYQRKKLIDLLPNNIVKGPEPKGLSGCGVWKISGSFENLNSIKYHPIGIIIEYFKEYHLLLGTRMRVITECLRKLYDPSIPISKKLGVNIK